ncbi:MAG: glycine zipper 2TM domain-containing protein [Burkholderiales bacterium]
MIGGLAGGLIGSAMGEGSGKTLATVAGAADLPDFFVPIISRRMAPDERGAHEEESTHRRADGHGAVRGRPHYGGRGGQEAQGERAHHLCLA